MAEASDDMSRPLDQVELDRLGDFLLARVRENDEGWEEGITDVSTLDGFFTALVSGPEAIEPSRWLPEVWGDFEPAWQSQDEFREIFQLMGRHMNGISATLMESPDQFEPLFFEHESGGRTYLIVDEWCDGYMRGVSMAPDSWDAGGEEMVTLLTPILTFATKSGWEVLEEYNDEEVEEIQHTIPPAVREIHAWWLERRSRVAPDSHTHRH